MPFHTDSHVKIEVAAGNTDQIRGSLSAELFEEKIEEINRDLSKFDTVTDFQSKSNSPTGKENILESMTINEIFMKATQARATPSGSNRAPLSVIPDTSNINTANTVTWKRQVRYTTGTDVIMEDAVGSKRSAHPTGGQLELQKKKRNLFLGLPKVTKRYWRRLVPSPARTNESFMLELSGAWAPTYRESACRISVGKRSLRCVFSRDMDG